MEKITVLSVVLFLFIGTINANGEDANIILKKMDDVLYSSKDMTGKLSIILINKSGKERERKATIMQKGTDKRIFRFTAPASQKGIAVLSLPNDLMYLYLPAFGKERRISSSIKSQKFAGTDFSYEDMESTPYSEKYSPKLIGTENDIYILELKPKSPKSVYSKIIVHVHRTNYYPIYMEFYDKGNNKIKVATYKFREIGEYWNAEEVVMTDLKKNHKTKMLMTDVEYDVGLTNKEFTVRRLKQ